MGSWLYLICSCEIIIKINFPLSFNITELHTLAAPCNVSPSVNPVSNLTSISDHDWVVFDGHALSYDDKLVIPNKKWLNDNIIYIGQLLIKRLCPDTNGFYSSQLAWEKISVWANLFSIYSSVTHQKVSLDGCIHC